MANSQMRYDGRDVLMSKENAEERSNGSATFLSNIAHRPVPQTISALDAPSSSNTSTSTDNAPVFPFLPAGIVARSSRTMVKPSTSSPSWNRDLGDLISEGKIGAGILELDISTPTPTTYHVDNERDSTMDGEALNSERDASTIKPLVSQALSKNPKKRRAEELEVYQDVENSGNIASQPATPSLVANRTTKLPYRRKPSDIMAPAVFPGRFTVVSGLRNPRRPSSSILRSNNGLSRPPVPLFHEPCAKRAMLSFSETDGNDRLTSIGAIRRAHEQEMAEKDRQLTEARIKRDLEQVEKGNIARERDEQKEINDQKATAILKLTQKVKSLESNLDENIESLEYSEDLRGRIALEQEGSENLLEQTHLGQIEELSMKHEDEIGAKNSQIRGLENSLGETQQALTSETNKHNFTKEQLSRTVKRHKADAINRDRTISDLQASLDESKKDLNDEKNIHGATKWEVTQLRLDLEKEVGIKNQKIQELADLKREVTYQLREKTDTLDQAAKQYDHDIKLAEIRISQEYQTAWNTQRQDAQNFASPQQQIRDIEDEVSRRLNVGYSRLRKEAIEATRTEFSASQELAIESATKHFIDSVNTLQIEKNGLAQTVLKMVTEKDTVKLINVRLVGELDDVKVELEALKNSIKPCTEINTALAEFESKEIVTVRAIPALQGPSPIEIQLREERNSFKGILEETLADLRRLKENQQPEETISSAPAESEIPQRNTGLGSQVILDGELSPKKCASKEVSDESSVFQPVDNQTIEVSLKKALAREHHYSVEASKFELALDEEKAKVKSLQWKNAEQQKIITLSCHKVKVLEREGSILLHKVADLEKGNTEFEIAFDLDFNTWSNPEAKDSEEDGTKSKVRSANSLPVREVVLEPSQDHTKSGKKPTGNGRKDQDENDDEESDRNPFKEISSHVSTSNEPCQRCIQYRRLEKAAKNKYQEILKKKLNLTDEVFKASIGLESQWEFHGLPSEKDDCGGSDQPNDKGGCVYRRGRVQTIQALRDLAWARAKDLQLLKDTSLQRTDGKTSSGDGSSDYRKAKDDFHGECLKCKKYTLRINNAKKDLKNCLDFIQNTVEEYTGYPTGIPSDDGTLAEEHDCPNCQGLRHEEHVQDKIFDLNIQYANSIRDPNAFPLTKDFFNAENGTYVTQLKVDTILANVVDDKIRSKVVAGIMVAVQNFRSEESANIARGTFVAPRDPDMNTAPPLETCTKQKRSKESSENPSNSDVEVIEHESFTDMAVQTESLHSSKAELEVDIPNFDVLSVLDKETVVEDHIIHDTADFTAIEPVLEESPTVANTLSPVGQAIDEHRTPEPTAAKEAIQDETKSAIIEETAVDLVVVEAQSVPNSGQSQRYIQRTWLSRILNKPSFYLGFGFFCIFVGGFGNTVWGTFNSPATLPPTTTILQAVTPPFTLPRPINLYIPGINGPTCDNNIKDLAHVVSFPSFVSMLNNAPTCDNIHLSRNEWPNFPSTVQAPLPRCCLSCKPYVSNYTLRRHIRDVVRASSCYTHFDSNHKIVGWVIRGGTAYGGYRHRMVVTG